MRSVRVPTVGLVALMLAGRRRPWPRRRRAEAPAAPVDARPGAPAPRPRPRPRSAPRRARSAVPLPDAVEGQRYVCGFVTVPQRHADPAGTQLQLAAIRILGAGQQRAADPRGVRAGGAGRLPALTSRPARARARRGVPGPRPDPVRPARWPRTRCPSSTATSTTRSPSRMLTGQTARPPTRWTRSRRHTRACADALR